MLAKVERILRIAEHAHGLFRTRHFGAAACRVQIDLAQLLIDLRRGQPIGGELRGIEDHADLTIDAAIALDAAHALDR